MNALPHEKFGEILLAFRIEKTLSKPQILEGYLNYIDFGNFSGQQLFGVQKAAMAYFAKEVSELEIHECALLAGIPKGTTLYSPIKNPENSKRRRNIVLRAMFDQGFITSEEYHESWNQPSITSAKSFKNFCKNETNHRRTLCRPYRGKT